MQEYSERRRALLRSAGAAALGVAAVSEAGAVDGEGGDAQTGGEGSSQADHRIVVGPDGEFVFDPERLEIDPGDSVKWVWDSANHNVAPESVPPEADWDGHPEIADDGHEYVHTFEVEGFYEYICEPHAAAGMEAELVVGDTDATPEDNVWTTADDPQVTVGPGGNLVFDPDEIVVETGTTVTWTWDSDNHNVAPTAQPDGAEWDGHPDISNTGEEYEHTFEVTGTYEYVCEPHVAAGMEGVVTVVDPNENGGDGNETTSEDGDADGPTNGTDGDAADSTNGTDGDASSDDGSPGPGIVGALGGLGATAGWLARQTGRDEQP